MYPVLVETESPCSAARAADLAARAKGILEAVLVVFVLPEQAEKIC